MKSFVPLTLFYEVYFEVFMMRNVIYNAFDTQVCWLGSRLQKNKFTHYDAFQRFKRNTDIIIYLKEIKVDDTNSFLNKI